MYRAQSAEAEAGRRGEAVVRKWAIAEGWLVLEASAIGSGPTMFQDANGKVIALDQLHLRGGITRWVDVKWKAGAILFRIASVLRHGIDLHSWRHYLEIWNRGGVEACLAIVELRRERNDESLDPHLLWQSFVELQKMARLNPEPHQSFPRGAAWWDRAAFDDLGPVDIGNDNIPATHLHLHPWEHRSLGVLHIDQNIPKPSPEEIARRMKREEALRIWHTTPSIKEPFETWWASLVREGKA